jgi:hypothetical protein
MFRMMSFSSQYLNNSVQVSSLTDSARPRDIGSIGIFPNVIFCCIFDRPPGGNCFETWFQAAQIEVLMYSSFPAALSEVLSIGSSSGCIFVRPIWRHPHPGTIPDQIIRRAAKNDARGPRD